MYEHREFTERDVESSIATRFAQQVDAYPDRLAVRGVDRCLTYADLHRASNRVANALLAMRGDSEEPAFVLAEPGPAAIVLLLGALKAGKFYVPLDPSHPPARLRAIVKEVGPAPILTTTVHDATIAAIAVQPSLVLNCDRLDDASEQPPLLRVSRDRLGYLFYTSGSTGRPKGVMQTQRNILHQIRTYTNGLRIAADDRLTLLHSHAFSASRLDIFGALLNGAAVCPLSVNDAGLSALARWLADEDITLSHWVPTLFRYFGGALDDRQRFPRMRVVVLGSEPVVPGDIALYKKHFGEQCVLVNRFGATEAGNICWSFFDKDAELPSGVVPVGLPLPGVDVFLTDKSGARIEPGLVGEICVRSAYLSPGYWKDPELTRIVFQPDPEGADRRVYRTGDLGRLRPDGALEHLGRKDSQVKIRGFRVETPEVEALLSTHPDLQESVIDVATDERGERRLIAYVVPVPGRIVCADGIRAFVSDALPRYMVPSSILLLEALPRTPTGKIDRHALLEMHGEAVSPPRVPPPLDPTERTLIGIWAQILGVIAVTATDNFFELGGNSLLAAQMMMTIERTFGRHLSPAAVFRAPTVHQLAEVLRRDRIEEPSVPSLVPIQLEGSQTPFFWIHGDRSNAYLSDYLGSDRPLYGLMHQSLDGRPAVYTRVETMAGHYVRQIQTVQADGPYLLGGYSFGGAVAFEIAQQLRDQGHQVALLVMLDSLYPGEHAHLAALDERTGIHRGSSSSSGRTLSRFGRFAELGFSDGVTYLRAGVTARVNAAMGRILSPTVKRAVCNACLRLNWRLPAFVRSFYILGIYREALKNYSPRPFAGPTVYFKSSSRGSTHQKSWGALMEGGFDVHEVPGDHTTIIMQENARPWAERLRQCVADAQRPAYMGFGDGLSIDAGYSNRPIK